MQYDFSTVLDRSGYRFIAVDVNPFPDVAIEEGFSKIPMWVADMSFPTAPPVLDAIRNRLDMPNFGYFELPDLYYDSILSWHNSRKPVEGLAAEHILYENSVLGGVSSTVCALTEPGDPVLLHSPLYVGFSEVMEQTGRRPVCSSLVPDRDGIWRMDYEDMDRKIKENGIRLAIFCSPHNPCGRVWEREEILQAMEVFRANGCTVISDEIWSDILMPGHTHIPTASVSADAKSRTVSFYAPSKTFSLAGLIGSYGIVFDPELREQLKAYGGKTFLNSPNVLSMSALIGAYSAEGEEWVRQMNLAVEKNLRTAHSFITSRFPGVRSMLPEGTYMLFLDCSEYCEKYGVPIQELQRRAVRKGVIWQDGTAFLWPDSIRMNLALPFSLLEKALDILEKYVFTEVR